MVKKKQIEDKTRYIPEHLEDIMGNGFSRYAKYIIQERALPDARDVPGYTVFYLQFVFSLPLFIPPVCNHLPM